MAQGTDTVATYSLSAYMDMYYAYYTDSTGPGDFQQFPTTSPVSNSIGLNTLQVSSKFDGKRIRELATIHVGDIARSTWSSTYNLVQEAHGGFRIYKNLWVDVGFFRTHFGTELLLPCENITSSVTVGTFHEPYYQAAARLNYTAHDQWEISLYLLNGYGLYADNNHRKSVGMAVNYTVNEALSIGYTNYLGNDAPDSVTISKTMFANNMYINYREGNIKLQIGGDFFTERHANLVNRANAALMYSGLATVGYYTDDHWGVYTRGEIFHDPNGLVSKIITDATGHRMGFMLWGITTGLEFRPNKQSYIRLEGRKLQMDSHEAIFRYNGMDRNYRYEIMLNAGISFTLINGVLTRS
ncbi:MAG: outer membrane beta-barrel protein [Chitinophagales bacterium]|nr:outer membrane beta-barrel protein [Chitinophagales bacterium]